MPLAFAIKGFAIGFAIAAPVGPIGVLCIRRSLAEGKWVGLVTGLGAATADAAYGAIAAFGLTAFSGFLVEQRTWLGLVGGVFLCYLGIRTFVSKPADEAARVRRGGMLAAYFSTLFLTLTNPMTILSFAAVFASLGLAASPSYSSAGLMVVGVFAGSAFWWLLLSNGVALFRSRMTPQWMRAVNRISGCIILGFALFSLFHFLYSKIAGSP
jgi:threonine/homoserine/homoserine lactone efflux protein